MDDNVVRTCVSCISEKHINKVYEHFSEYHWCVIKRVLKRYYNKIVEISQQRPDKNARLKTWIIEKSIGRKALNLTK